MPGTRLVFTEVASGSHAAVTGFSVQVARNATEARALYDAAYGRQTSTAAASVSGARTLVGVFLGQRNTGGYGVKIRDARLNGRVLTLVAEVTAPGEGMLTTQALTSPWTMVSVAGDFTEVHVVDTAGRSLQATPSGNDR